LHIRTLGAADLGSRGRPQGNQRTRPFFSIEIIRDPSRVPVSLRRRHNNHPPWRMLRRLLNRPSFRRSKAWLFCDSNSEKTGPLELIHYPGRRLPLCPPPLTGPAWKFEIWGGPALEFVQRGVRLRMRSNICRYPAHRRPRAGVDDGVAVQGVRSFSTAPGVSLCALTRSTSSRPNRKDTLTLKTHDVWQNTTFSAKLVCRCDPVLV